jgi:NAD(P)-dependent dehydrogenase (short-subunit alcohol dehydrogenase family)
MCLITGAAGGIGRAIALRLVDEGASVVLCDIAEEPVESLATEIGGQALAFVADVCDERAIKKAAQLAVDGFGVSLNSVIVGSNVAAEVMRAQGSGDSASTWTVAWCSIDGLVGGVRSRCNKESIRR